MNFVFHCHNCGLTKTLKNFLYNIDSLIYSEYKRETSFKKFKNDEPIKIKKNTPNMSTENIVPVNILDKNHECIKYIQNRLIPEDSWDKLFWCQDFSSLVKEMFGSKYEGRDFPTKGLLFKIHAIDGVFPSIVGVQLRSIDPNCHKSKRFITCMEDNWSTAFGYEGHEPKYVVEGPIDSLFLDDCIASINSSLWRVKFPNAVYINDCEPRNPQIVKQVKKCIDLGYKVVLLPEMYSGLDINDIIKKFGYSKKELTDLIDSHTYQGLTAKMKFSSWKLS